MKIERMTEIETYDIEIGDRIHVDHYTATCQEITQKGALFCLDQYLDKPYQMNAEDTNKGGYKASDLRETLRSKEILDIFTSIRDYMVPFENGDLIRIPFAGELFGDNLPKWCEDGHKQWPLMRDRRNRVASRCDEYEWGWLQNKDTSKCGDYDLGRLQNKDKTPSTNFFHVNGNGGVASWTASAVIGVRPVFQIATYREEAEMCHS